MAISSLIRAFPAADQVFFNPVDGIPNDVIATLRRKVAAVTRTAWHMKVGMTNEPVRRWRQAYRRHGWHRMDVIYHTESYTYCGDIERALIARLMDGENALDMYFYNGCRGGGGRIPTYGPFHVYVVTAARHARISRD